MPTHITSLKFARLAAFGWASIMLISCSEISMANDNLSDVERLKVLRTATDIVLMIVPYRTSFRTRVDESQLPSVSCVYEISSDRGPTFNVVLDIVASAVTQYDEPKPVVDLRVGIIMRSNGKTLREFYFNDLGGSGNLNGFSGDRRVSASADLPSRLRALVTHQDVVLTRDRHSRCPHA